MSKLPQQSFIICIKTMRSPGCLEMKYSQTMEKRIANPSIHSNIAKAAAAFLDLCKTIWIAISQTSPATVTLSFQSIYVGISQICPWHMFL